MNKWEEKLPSFNIQFDRAALIVVELISPCVPPRGREARPWSLLSGDQAVAEHFGYDDRRRAKYYWCCYRLSWSHLYRGRVSYRFRPGTGRPAFSCIPYTCPRMVDEVGVASAEMKSKVGSQ